jgi:hypothetical protein
VRRRGSSTWMTTACSTSSSGQPTALSSTTSSRGKAPTRSLSSSDAFGGIKVSYQAKPRTTDLDGDGLLDLVVADGNGQLSHFEQDPAGSGGFTQVEGTFDAVPRLGSAVPCFGDVNGDGLDDLLIGTTAGGVSLFLREDGCSSGHHVSGSYDCLQPPSAKLPLMLNQATCNASGSAENGGELLCWRGRRFSFRFGAALSRVNASITTPRRTNAFIIWPPGSG